MKARRLYQGTGDGHDIYVVPDGRGRFRASEFLVGLKDDPDDDSKDDSNAVYKAIQAVLKTHSTEGIIFNTEVSRPIKGRQNRGLFEFKAKVAGRGTARLLYFYDGRRRTLLTNGCFKIKPKRFTQEIRRARTIMMAFKKRGTF